MKFAARPFALAEFDKKPELTVIIETIQSLDRKQDKADTSVVFDLVRQLTSRPGAELTPARAELESWPPVLASPSCGRSASCH